MEGEEVVTVENGDDKLKADEMVEVAGLKMTREGVLVISLTAANIFMFMLICWYKRRSNQKIEIILEE